MGLCALIERCNTLEVLSVAACQSVTDISIIVMAECCASVRTLCAPRCPGVSVFERSRNSSLLNVGGRV